MIVRNTSKFPLWFCTNLIYKRCFIMLPENIPFAIAATLNDTFAKDWEAGIRKTTTFIGYLNALELVNRRLRRDW